MAIASKTESILRLIRDEMSRQGLKQKDLALTLKKSKGWVSLMMNGNVVLTVEVLLEIAEKLGIEAASLLPAKSEQTKPIGFEEFVRKICQDEIKKTKSKKGEEK